MNGKQITDSVATLLIFQDLTTPVWSVQLEIIDTVNNASKIKEGDSISISIETKQGYDTDGRYKFNCYIYEIADRTWQGNNRRNIKIPAGTL
jgi:hypothetical protein